MLVSEHIKDFRGRSFFINNELVCEILMLFFRTSISGWVSLSINEGIAIFSQVESEPFLLDLNEINDEFAYPIKNIPQLTDYIEKNSVII